MRSSLVRLSFLVAFVLMTAGCGWPMFGFSASGGRYNNTETAIGAGNVGSLTPAWTASGSFGSPVAAGDFVYTVGGNSLYVFSASGSQGCSGTPATCSPLWTARMGGGGPTPALANGVVYVSSVDGNLYAFDAAGNTGCSGVPKVCSPLWTAKTGGTIGSSPVVDLGVVYVGSADGNLYAFDAASGRLLWIAPTGYRIRGTPAVAVVAGGYDVFVANENDVVYAFEAGPGPGDCVGFFLLVCEPDWHTQVTYGLGPGATDGALAVVNNILYITSQGPYSALFTYDCSGTAFALCSLLGSEPTPPEGSPAVANGVAYFTAEDNSLRTSGSLSAQLPDGPFSAQSAPAVANGVVYVCDPAGNVDAFDAADLALLWSADVGTNSDPTIANGVLYVPSATGLTAFKPSSS